MQCTLGTSRAQLAHRQHSSRVPPLVSSRICSSRSSSSSQSQKQHVVAARRGVPRQTALTCRAADERPPAGSSSSSSSSGLAVKFNPVYLVIFGAYSALLVFRNPYIYAVLTVLTILPQNSNVTSLNNLVLLFYESGLFQNFAEAVNCVRLVTWLSMGFMVASFALFK